MITTVLAPAQWAQMEFALARLGDQRRTQRLVKIATRLAQSPGGTLPQAMPQWGELKAAYRFFSQPRNSYEPILRPHWERTQAACQEPGEYLLIEDTTLLDYSSHPATEDLGQIGDGGRGLLRLVLVEHFGDLGQVHGGHPARQLAEQLLLADAEPGVCGIHSHL